MRLLPNDLKPAWKKLHTQLENISNEKGQELSPVAQKQVGILIKLADEMNLTPKESIENAFNKKYWHG